ncbi:MAG: HAMP domain-containing histidine kinase [Acidobacteriota bacterium]|nr:HAMP domain-containing histidine kinase [Acidobacteriota bacterium]
MRRFQLQLVFVLLAAISVATLSAILISGAIHGAERVVIADTRKALDAANSELAQQYTDRVNSDPLWASLPLAAQDISLSAISQAALRSYPGVEGGFFAGSTILGYSYPTHGSGNAKMDVPEAELPEIKEAIRQARLSGRGERILRGSRDVVLIQAISSRDHVCWTMKRLSGISDPGEKRRNALLIWLGIAALVSITGTLAIAIGLRKGIAEIQGGLARLETDFAFELPVTGGELGSICRAVNRVARTRRRLESELRREDRLRAIGRMAANIAHEIRNPLNGIRLAIQVLKQRLSSSEIRPDDLELVIGEVDRLNVLLTDLLAFREARKPCLEEQPVLPVIARCVDLLETQARERSIQMRIRTDDPQAHAVFDAKQLTQVLTNLLLNSLAAIPGEGAIDVSVHQNGGGVSIEVHDTGPGVAPEHREHLFEAFYTTRGEGTGLGLAVSRELVNGMGATLVYRDDRPGATFTIQLSAQKGLNETRSHC